MRRVQPVPRGLRVTALRQPINRIVDEVNARDVRPSGSVPARELLPQILIPLEIKTLNAATLTCVAPGEGATVGVLEYEVTPPPTFTEASRDGVNYTYTDINTRTADDGTAETQEITPKYIVGDLIYAAEIEEGVIWRDLNIDGRQWAKTG